MLDSDYDIDMSDIQDRKDFDEEECPESDEEM